MLHGDKKYKEFSFLRLNTWIGLELAICGFLIWWSGTSKFWNKRCRELRLQCF